MMFNMSSSLKFVLNALELIDKYKQVLNNDKYTDYRYQIKAAIEKFQQFREDKYSPEGVLQ